MIFAKFFIESKSNKRGYAKRNLELLINKIKRELKVLNYKIEDEIFEEGFYSSFIETEIEFENLLQFLCKSLELAPVAVEVYKPSILRIDLKEFTETIKEFMKILRNFYSKYNIYIKLFGKSINKIRKEKIEELIDEGYIKARFVFHLDENLLKFLSDNYYLVDYKFDRKNNLLGVYLMVKPYEIFSIIIRRIPMYIKLEDAFDIEIKNFELQDVSLEISSIVNEYIFRKTIQGTF